MIEKTIERADAGLRFHSVKTDRFKMSRLSFNFILPADSERSPKTSLMLATMMRGCEKYPTISALNKRLDEFYGATATWRAVSVGARHVFRISCEVLSDRYRFADDKESIIKGVCEIILEILFSPLRGEDGLLSGSNFESERKLAIDAIKAKINNQKSYAAEKCAKLMLEGDPAGISTRGTVEQLEKMTLAEVSENLGSFLKDSMLECYYVGSDDVSEIVDLIGDRFATLGRERRELFGKETAFIRAENSEIKRLEETMNVSQARLNIGCTSGVVMSDPESYAAMVFNEIFGGSSVAKLFMNVREKKSLCYYCYSSYSSATGTVMIACGIKPENRDVAYSEIENQLGEMKVGNFSDDDILTAKKTLISGVTQTVDNPSAIEAFSFRRFLAGVDESVDDCISKINAVTKEEIVDLANRIRFDTVYFLCGNGEEEDECDE